MWKTYLKEARLESFSSSRERKLLRRRKNHPVRQEQSYCSFPAHESSTLHEGLLDMDKTDLQAGNLISEGTGRGCVFTGAKAYPKTRYPYGFLDQMPYVL